MTIFLPKVQKQPSTGERFANAFASAAMEGTKSIPEHFVKQQQMQQENEALKQMGIDVSGVQDPDARKLLIAESLKGKQAQAKQAEKMKPYEMGLNTINRMRELSNVNKIGRGSGILGIAGGETAQHKKEYEQLGKSLISLASTIPIRNQKEFETLSKDLYDSSLTQGERNGVLDAMERIIKESLGQENDIGTQEQSSQQKQPRFSPNGNVLMRKSDGTLGQVPRDKVELALSKGYTYQ